MIPVSFSLFLYFSLFLLLLLLFYVIIYFYKNFIIIIILFIYFFLKIILFFHVPGCSGMFRHVPECSMFLVLSTASVADLLQICWFPTAGPKSNLEGRNHFSTLFSVTKHEFVRRSGNIDHRVARVEKSMSFIFCP